MRIASTTIYLFLGICFINFQINAQARLQSRMVFSVDSSKPTLVYNDPNAHLTTYHVDKKIDNFPAISELLSKNERAQVELGYSKSGKAIKAFYFPGSSTNRALVIGGVHGSELSAIEIARQILEKLTVGDPSHYSVMVVPVLFPDNEILALKKPDGSKKVYNTGRYSHKEAADPNRQMPPLGKAFNKDLPVDHLGREIETENQLLLQLIAGFQPNRIINLHAIRDIKQAGIYADPRTDHQGFALGFETDSSLVLDMAKFIYENGGNVSGNRFDTIPSALYYNDPPIMNKGYWQARNLTGSRLPGDRGQGVSLGSWASTAICDSLDTLGNRAAMRLITVEFPGYKMPTQYPDASQQTYYAELIQLYTTAIQKFFLGDFYPEDFKPCDCNPPRTNSPALLSDRN